MVETFSRKNDPHENLDDDKEQYDNKNTGDLQKELLMSGIERIEHN
jgi:hypothetical protein